MANEIYLEVDGKKFDGWKTVNFTKSIDKLCGSFSFTSSSTSQSSFPVKVGQSCKIVVEDTPMLNGWIEKISVNYDVDDHTITVSGRDRTNDVVDCQPDFSKLQFTPNISLKRITEKVLESLYLSDIKVIDRFNLKPFKKITTDGVGTKAFDFLQRYAKISQVLLTTNGEGNIVFERALGRTLNTILSTRRGEQATILSSSVDYDNTKRFYHYNLNSQGQLANDFQPATAQKAASIKADAFDNEIRKSRLLYFQPTSSTTDQQAIDTAAWEANFRRADSMVYSCEVQGFRPINDQTNVWLPNYLINIVDDFVGINTLVGAGIKSPLLITEVSYSKSLDEGSKVALKLQIEDAFTLQVNRKTKDKKDKTVGNAFVKS
jgi:prophage tail gpP-like protein